MEYSSRMFKSFVTLGVHTEWRWMGAFSIRGNDELCMENARVVVRDHEKSVTEAEGNSACVRSTLVYGRETWVEI